MTTKLTAAELAEEIRQLRKDVDRLASQFLPGELAAARERLTKKERR
jgi:hypothetical protein